MSAWVAPLFAERRFPRAIGTTLATRFVFVASVLTLLFVLVVGGLSYYFTRVQIISGVEAHLDNEAALHAERVASTLTSVVKTLSPLTQNSLILNSLMDSLTRDTTLIPFLKDFSTISGIPVGIAFTDFEGVPIAGKRKLALGLPGWKPSVLGKGEPFVEIREGANGAMLVVAEPVIVTRTLSPEGALIYEVMLEDVLLSGAIEPPLNHRVRLVHERMPAHTPGANSGTRSDGVASPLKTTRSLQVPEILVPLGLSIEVSEDPEVVQAPLRRLLYTYVIASILLMIVGLLISVLLARYLARPLRDLESVASRVVTSGSFSHRFAVQGIAETAHLGNVFNQMLERLGKAHEELKHQAKEAALRNQELANTNVALKNEITYRKRAERDAQKAQKVLLGATENMPDGFALVDEQDRLVLCNERYKELFPQIRDLIEPGASFPDLLKAAEMHERIATATGPSNERLLNIGTSATQGDSTLEFNTSDGRWIEARDYPTPGIGRICIRIDITKRKASEWALHESEERLRTIYQSVNDGIFILDPSKDQIIEVNPSALKLLEYTADEISLIPVSKVHPNEMSKLQEFAKEVAEKGFSRTTQLSCTTKSGKTIPVEISASSINLRGRALMLAMVRDNRERKLAEEALQRTHQELEAAYQELRNFTYMVSHDLRAPLVNIKGFSNELGLALVELHEIVEPLLATASDTHRNRLKTLLSEDVPEATHFIEESASKMDHQINAILTLSRVGHRDFSASPVDMNKLLAEALASQAHRIETGDVQVEVQDLPIVMTDQVAMEQIISNLLDNAVKYLDPSRPGRISVSVDQVNGETRFHVQDNGVGIAQDDVKLVFQIFRRVGSDKVLGEGVGLSYALANVRRLGGNIWCRSEVGVGSTFTFSVPDTPPSKNSQLSATSAVPLG